jgi:hypothetical protein
MSIETVPTSRNAVAARAEGKGSNLLLTYLSGCIVITTRSSGALAVDIRQVTSPMKGNLAVRVLGVDAAK